MWRIARCCGARGAGQLERKRYKTACAGGAQSSCSSDYVGAKLVYARSYGGMSSHACSGCKTCCSYLIEALRQISVGDKHYICIGELDFVLAPVTVSEWFLYRTCTMWAYGSHFPPDSRVSSRHPKNAVQDSASA